MEQTRGEREPVMGNIQRCWCQRGELLGGLNRGQLKEREGKKAKHRGKSPGKCLKGHCPREGMKQRSLHSRRTEGQPHVHAWY